MSMSDWSIRAAELTDVPDILAMIRELAEYEREPEAVKTTTADLTRALFEGGDGPHSVPAAYCDVATATGSPDAPLLGMALWYLTFSTWEGVHGIYLEDLYVRPAARGSGLGHELLASLARRCVDNGYTRLEWSALNWNTPAIDFYLAHGAQPQTDWTKFRLCDDTLHALGTE